jgi:CubicO group peptidase (beta-lactamase class C family)
VPEIIKGECQPDFRAVRRAFEKNFADHGELGAAVAVYHKGRLVVDLWGGVRDRERSLPWEADTICCMMSVAKGICSLCIAILAERGLLTLDDTVSKYWPEFAAGGKGGVTIRQALGHLACIPALEAASEGDFYDYRKMVDLIAAQPPLWPIGTQQVYHSATLGFMAGEILRRITGETIGQFIRKNLQEPLRADYFIGLSASEQQRCATMVRSTGNSINAAKAADPQSVEARMWKPLPADETFNSAAWRGVEMPSVNGHGTARGVARIYGALANGGSIDGVHVIDMNALAPFREEQHPSPPPPVPQRLRMAVGFMLNSPPHRVTGPNPESFGHSGAGGSQAFCDPIEKIGFCYTTNLMQNGTETGIRAESLVESVFDRARRPRDLS